MQNSTAINLNQVIPLKIAVLGAAGNVGSRVVKEAIDRGHKVTAIVQDAEQAQQQLDGIRVITTDVSVSENVTQACAGQDVVISAIRPSPGSEGNVIPTTRAILDGLAESETRLLVVGGAATLRVPGSGGKTVLGDTNYLPVAARHIGQASADQFYAIQGYDLVDWVYLSPPAQMEPGERTGRYRLGIDDLLVDAEGRSRISMEDLSVALLDEAEAPRHHRSRFTVAY